MIIPVRKLYQLVAVEQRAQNTAQSMKTLPCCREE